MLFRTCWAGTQGYEVFCPFNCLVPSSFIRCVIVFWWVCWLSCPYSNGSGYFLIVADFNFHVDSQNNVGWRFTGLLHSFNLRQHVNDSMHKNGHTLDLVITREEQSFIKNLLVFDPALSNHFMIRCNLDFVNMLPKIKCYLFDVYVPLTCISSPLTWKTPR